MTPTTILDVKGYYRTLGVSVVADAEEIKRAARRLLFENHPDRGGNVNDFIAVNEAYHVLSDYRLRKEYDETLSASDGLQISFECPVEQHDLGEFAYYKEPKIVLPDGLADRWMTLILPLAARCHVYHEFALAFVESDIMKWSRGMFLIGMNIEPTMDRACGIVLGSILKGRK